MRKGSAFVFSLLAPNFWASGQRWLGLFALYWIIALATHAEGLYQPMFYDYCVRLRVARDWRNGLKLYEETYENTQPTYFLYIRFVDSSRPEVSHYFSETVLAAIAAVALSGALRRSAPRCAMVAPVLLIAWSGIGPTFHGGQITEGISLWFDVIALCLFFGAVRRNSYILAILAGICFFLMVSFRVPCLFHALAYAPLVWLAYREQGFRRALFMVLAFSGGISLALAALIFHALGNSYFSAFLKMLARNFEYASATRITFSESLDRAWGTISGIIHDNPAFPILMTISILVFLPKAKIKKRDEPKVMSDEPLVTHHSSLITHHSTIRTRLWLWIGLLWLTAALASAFPGGRHWDHYYHVAWAPVSVLSVLWLSRSSMFAKERRTRRRLAWGLTIALPALAIVVNGRGFMRQTLRDDSPRAAIARAADFLEQNTRLDSPVPVCVWQPWCELYWRVPRPSVTRCIAPHCFYVIQRELFDEWVQAMIDRPPDLIVADGSLLGPMSSHWPYLDPHFRPPAGHPLYHLRRLVDENYVEIYRIDDLSFLARRNGPNDPHGK